MQQVPNRSWIPTASASSRHFELIQATSYRILACDPLTFEAPDDGQEPFSKLIGSSLVCLNPELLSFIEIGLVSECDTLSLAIGESLPRTSRDSLTLKLCPV